MNSRVTYANHPAGLGLSRPPGKGFWQFDGERSNAASKTTRWLVCVSIFLSITMAASLVVMIYFYFQTMSYLKEVDNEATKLTTSLKADYSRQISERDPVGFQILSSLATIRSASEKLQASEEALRRTCGGECKNNPPGDWIRNGDHLYYFSPGVKTWNDAESFCVEQKAHLVSITSVEEQKFLVTMGGQDKYWIGLTDLTVQGTLGPWRFVDGSPYGSLLFWAPGQPDNWENREHCAKMRYDSVKKDSVWNDVDCIDHRRWICKKECVV